MRAEDKELFKSFIRSLPRKDNYYLTVDAHDDQAINRWMNRVESGEIIGVIALEGSQMIGYCNLHTNNLPWIRHVGEMRMSVSAAHRGRGDDSGVIAPTIPEISRPPIPGLSRPPVPMLCRPPIPKLIRPAVEAA